MSDFLTRLALRQLGQIATVEPRVPVLYSTAPEGGQESFGETTEYHAMVATENASPKPQGQATGDVEQPSVHVESRSPHLMTSKFKTERAPSEAPRATTSGDTEIWQAGPWRSAADERDVSAPCERAAAESLLPERKMLVASAPTAVSAPTPLVKPARHDASRRLYAPVVPLRAAGETRIAQAADREESPVHVTIGRIEVTASPMAAAPKRAQAPRKPTMSLDDYLARRQGKDR